MNAQIVVLRRDAAQSRFTIICQNAPPQSSPIEGEEVVKASIRSPDLWSGRFTKKLLKIGRNVK